MKRIPPPPAPPPLRQESDLGECSRSDLLALVIILLVVALSLAGCAGQAQEMPGSWMSYVEDADPPRPDPPPECKTASDPTWSVPPETGEFAADTARREDANKRAFRVITARRRICAAGVTVDATKPKEGKHAQK